MPIDAAEADARARDRMPFSNSSEGVEWMAHWCDRCTVDAPYRSGIVATGCPLILLALSNRTPAEWIDGPRDEHGAYSMARQYLCTEFKPRGGGGGGEPRPRPVPREQGVLFDRPQQTTRMLVQPQEVMADA